MVGARPLYLAFAVFYAAPKVAAANDDADLDAKVHACLDRIADFPYDVKIEPGPFFAGKRFAAYLE